MALASTPSMGSIPRSASNSSLSSGSEATYTPSLSAPLAPASSSSVSLAAAKSSDKIEKLKLNLSTTFSQDSPRELIFEFLKMHDMMNLSTTCRSLRKEVEKDKVQYCRLDGNFAIDFKPYLHSFVIDDKWFALREINEKSLPFFRAKKVYELFKYSLANALYMKYVQPTCLEALSEEIVNQNLIHFFKAVYECRVNLAGDPFLGIFEINNIRRGSYQQRVAYIKKFFKENPAIPLLFEELTIDGLEFLPSEIGYFKNLRKLKITGLKALSSEIGNLTRLTNLDLSYGNLRYLPLDLKNLHLLENLNLFHNRLASFPSINGLYLESLDLSNNNLKILPSEIGNFRWLKRLNLSDNQIELIPVEIAKLANLKFLIFFNNKIKNIPVEIHKFIVEKELNFYI
jgi:Leucine-rich repeat (LRR) protein